MSSNKEAPVYGWDDLPGYETYLQRARSLRRSTDRLPHVILVWGDEANQILRFAHALAGLYYCHSARACGDCSGCKQTQSRLHPDLLVIDQGDEALKLAEAKELQEHLQFHPDASMNHLDPARVCIVARADLLNQQAANRLLKIIEEPPKYGRIILTASSLTQVLPTIRSRCVKWPIRLPSELRMLPEMNLSGEEETILQKLLAAKNPSAVLEAVQSLLKDHDYDVKVFCQKVELMLNKNYREYGAPSNLVLMQERRKKLRELRHLAGRQNITLNTSLSLESWGLG